MIVVLTGGGTMGHITPLMEFKEELEKRGNHTFYYLGNENYIEKEVAKKRNINFYHIRSSSTEGFHKLNNKISFIKRNMLGVKDATKMLREIKPDMIISTGGFVTAPILAAATMLKIPFFLHEQNKVVGKVNKLFLMKATQIYYTFEHTVNGQNKKTGKTFGNPVKRFETEGPKSSILFLGGSGGSEFMNELAIQYAKENPNKKIILQAGEKRKEKHQKKVEELNLTNIDVIGFESMGKLLSQAKVVISRAGSSTISELIENEKPMLVIPFPQSADDHQYENAKYVKDTGVGRMSIEKDGFEKIIKEINELQKSKKIQKNKYNIKKYKKVNIRENIINDMYEIMNGKMKFNKK